MQPVRDIIIVGGGLAGLTSAIHLSRAGLHVTVIEKSPYPKHKVCGEYISNEVLPYLEWLGADPSVLSPARIDRVSISAVNGRMVTTPLPMGGFGISRYKLDEFMMQIAVSNGCELIEDMVTDIRFSNDVFSVDTSGSGTLTASFVIGAYGKRSALDKTRSPWMAVKAHYKGAFENGLVALHNFHGGYCGVSKVENDVLNICYLVSAGTFKEFKNIDAHREAILFKNKHLRKIFENSEPLFERPLTISQISFADREKVNDHMLMTGDTAGLIHPLCGNGMAMAIHSAKIASELVLQCFYGITRSETEDSYTKAWKQAFGKRIKAGRILAGLFSMDRLSAAVMKGVVLVPGILPLIIRQTHGKSLKVS